MDLSFKFLNSRKNCAMFKQSLFFLLFFYTLLYSGKALTHNDWSNETKNLSKELYERALLFAPEILSPKDSLSHPYIEVNGKKVYLNSAFWNLVKGWLRVYHAEIKTYCECDMDPEKLAEQARDSIPKGFFRSTASKAKNKIENNAIHGMERMAHLSAKYGKTFSVLFGASEVAETIFFKGNHLLCKVNNILAFFITQPIQAFSSILSDSKTLTQNRLLMMIKWAWISRAVNKAQQKAFFHLESAQINSEGLRLVNQEGPQNKREKWVQKVAEKAAPLLEKAAKIDRQLKENELSERKRKQLLKRRAAITEKADSITQLSKQSYLGERYKWLLGLISRKKREGYLKGHAFPDEVSSFNWLWILAASENIMERAFVRQIRERDFEPSHFLPFFKREERLTPLSDLSSLSEEKIQEHFMPSLDFAPSLTKDAIRSGLAREFSKKLKERGLISNTEEHGRFTEQILEDAGKIFDPSLSMKEKYIASSIIHMTLNGFFSAYMEIAYKKLKEGDMKWSAQIKLRYIHSRFYFYTTRYSAFLQAASLTKDKASLISHKYEVMESLLSFFEYLIDLREVINIQSKEDMLSRLKENIRRIEALQAYMEKKTAFRLFGEGLPLCRDLIRRAKWQM